MKGSYLVAIVVAASIAMLGSCGGKGGKAGDILAEVNGEPVTAAQMNKEIEKLPVTQRTSFLSPAGKKDFLEALIRKKVILQSALKSGLGDDPGIREQVEEFRNRLMTEKHIESIITQNQKFTEEEIKDYFAKNKSAFVVPDRVRVRQIVSESEVAAQKIIAEIRKGAKFEELARKKSTDKFSRDAGGDLGFIKAGQLAQNIESSIFNLKNPGDMTQPIRSDMGYHVLQLVEKRKNTEPTLDQVRETIISRLNVDKKRTIYQNFLEKARKEAKVKVYDENFYK
jgi:peptidyl-prolyl cis-trans isomerase C